jgi:hypothetical protein
LAEQIRLYERINAAGDAAAEAVPLKEERG